MFGYTQKRKLSINSQDRDSVGLLVPKWLRDEWLWDQVQYHRLTGQPREVAEQTAMRDWAEALRARNL